MNLALKSLGDVLGPLTYLGSCACCRGQFMSTHEQVCSVNGITFCTKKECLEAAAAFALKLPRPVFNRTEQRVLDRGGVTDPGSYDVGGAS